MCLCAGARAQIDFICFEMKFAIRNINGIGILTVPLTLTHLHELHIDEFDVILWLHFYLFVP